MDSERLHMHSAQETSEKRLGVRLCRLPTPQPPRSPSGSLVSLAARAWVCDLVLATEVKENAQKVGSGMAYLP